MSDKLTQEFNQLRLIKLKSLLEKLTELHDESEDIDGEDNDVARAISVAEDTLINQINFETVQDKPTWEVKH